MTILEKLAALEAKATPSPWERDCKSHYDRSERQHYVEHFVTGHLRDRVCTAIHGDAQEITPDDRGIYSDERARADLDFIAALRNAWPLIKAVAETGVAHWDFHVNEKWPKDGGTWNPDEGNRREEAFFKACAELKKVSA